jgi:gluconolactonase
MHRPSSFPFAIALTFAVLSGSFSGVAAENPYPPGPDSRKQDDVPHGELIKGVFDQSRIFPGTIRDYTVYIPQQLDRSKPAPSMTLQDGGGYSAPNVFDNLIHKKEIPPLVGIFVMHGRVKALATNALDRFNRSYEYDGLGDSYARFLLDELFPFIEKKHNVKLSDDPNQRAIGGASSGAICAFTCAWERPDAFRRVFSSIGTYVGLRGGDVYPTLIRKTEPKPIRIFLQDGENDLNIYGGDWWMANQMMERALVFAGYDVNHAWGKGAHDGNQATQVFPDALRWLWRDYPAPIVANAGGKSKQPMWQVVDPAESWQLVSEGHKFTEGPAANSKGELFFTDIPNSRIHKVGLDGKVRIFAENTGSANGLNFGPDGKLYACANAKKQIVAFDEQGKATIVAGDLESNDLAINHAGNLYVTDPGNRQVWFIPKDGQKRVVDKGIAQPNGVVLSPDQSLLYVADTKGQFVYSFQIQPDGSLADKQRYFHLHLVDGSSQSGADGMTVDARGYLYVTSELGLQVCDQAGRVNFILPKPHQAWLSNATFGGPDLNELYVTVGDKVYKRKMRVAGVLSANAPIKPPAPRL